MAMTTEDRAGGIRVLHLVWLAGSAALAILLLVLLFRCGDLDVAAILRLLLGAPPAALIAITLLLAVNNALAGEKWRLIAERLQPASAAMPRLSYFAFTSIGVAFGQIVPAQLSLVLSRSIGAHLHGGGAWSRGATATLFDYFFDVLVAALGALASLLVVAGGGEAVSWAIYAGILWIGTFLLWGVATRRIAGIARLLSGLGCGRLGRVCGSLAVSPLLAPAIGRRLLAISLIRFILLVLAGAVSARAVGVALPLWQIAAAQPFAVVANALALTPGSLGVNEWSVSSALFALGVPFALSAQWALASRVLMALAALLCGLAGALIVVALRTPRRRGV